MPLTAQPAGERFDSPTEPVVRFAVDGLSDAFPHLSTKSRFSRGQIVAFAAVGFTVIVGLVVDRWVTASILMSLMIGLYTVMLLFRLDLARRGHHVGAFRFTDDELAALDEDQLPSFTILVPAYKEPEVIDQLVGNLAALEYPRHLLEIKLLLEEDDDETIAAAAALDLQAPFEVVIVPPEGPRTKPKALNYALLGSSGDLVCIYDAEDRPEPKQLLKVAAVFQSVGPEFACVQAELAYFNSDENVVTRWFATEYRTWFTQFLPALSAADAPIPLGGTSNHIRRDLLVQMGAWDPYNVTEDADLGIRLRRCGFRVALVDSVTLEEANTDAVNWVKQRSRWYKGYAQTWLVHMRNPIRLLRDVGLGGFLRFNLFVGGTPLIAALNPVSWMLVVAWFTLKPQFIMDIIPAPAYYAGMAGWLIGNFALYYLNLTVAYGFEQPRVFRAALALPVYWVLMAIAAVKAFVQLVFNPTYWEKTHHGLSQLGHVVAREAVVEAPPKPVAT
ncbi:MAG: glycosyltransferase [Actinobacteria bacterium]|nr:glycosyltransferase [Actinomycetota bacterium]